MKKVLFFINSLYRGGAERVTVNLCTYFLERNIECTIVTSIQRSHEYALPEGAKRIVLNKKSVIATTINLIRIMKAENPDVVLIMGVPNCLYAMPACIWRKVKVVVSERANPNQFTGKKIVKLLSRILMRFADGYVFQTNEAKEYYANKLNNRGKVIPNPLSSITIPERYTGKRVKTFFTAGRLIDVKNHTLLLNAFSDFVNTNGHKDFRLRIYGDGPLLENLKSLAKQNKIDSKVDFLGNVDNAVYTNNNVSAFILSSDSEGMPNALLEALVSGIPSISTNCPCGGPRDLIRNHENGILVPVKDRAGLVAAMEEIITEDISEKYSKAAYNDRLLFSMERIGGMWLDYLKSISD